MRSIRGANVRFHFACAAARKHLLLDARQRCRDFSLLTRTRGDGKRFVVRADAGNLRLPRIVLTSKGARENL